MTGTLPYKGTATFSYAQPKSPPSGVTGAAGSLSSCVTSESNTAPFGTYPGTISGCAGLHLTGASAHNYSVSYVYGDVTVTKGQVKVTVKGTQPYLGSPTFAGTVQTPLPAGITKVTGTLSGCKSSVASSAGAGTYQGTISSCTGLGLTGSSASLYAPDYVDGGVTVTPLPLKVKVVGNQPFHGTPIYTYSQPTTLPTGVTGVAGELTGCTTKVTRTAAIGTYPGTVSGCGGLGVTGTKAADYTPSYTYVALYVFAGPTGTSLVTGPVVAPTLFATDAALETVSKYPSPYTSHAKLATTQFTANSIASDQAGDVFYIMNTYNQYGWEVREITAAGAKKVLVKQYPDPTNAAIQDLGTRPTGLAVNGAGDLYICDTSNGRVLELAPPYSGTPTVVASALDGPSGVAVDSAGDLFIANDGNDDLVEVTPGYGSTPVEYASGGGRHPVRSVAVDAAGDVYFGEQANGPSTTGHVYELEAPLHRVAGRGHDHTVNQHSGRAGGGRFQGTSSSPPMATTGPVSPTSSR